MLGSTNEAQLGDGTDGNTGSTGGARRRAGDEHARRAAAEVALGGYRNYGHSCALKTDGTPWCWGSNLYGQVGDGSPWTLEGHPVQVGGAPAAMWPRSGSALLCSARKTDGTLVLGMERWAVGDGTTADKHAGADRGEHPRSNVAEVAVGLRHRPCASDGRYLWKP